MDKLENKTKKELIEQIEVLSSLIKVQNKREEIFIENDIACIPYLCTIEIEINDKVKKLANDKYDGNMLKLFENNRIGIETFADDYLSNSFMEQIITELK